MLLLLLEEFLSPLHLGSPEPWGRNPQLAEWIILISTPPSLPPKIWMQVRRHREGY